MKCDWCGQEATEFVKVGNGEEGSFFLVEKLCRPHKEQVPEGISINEGEYHALQVMDESPSLRDFMASANMIIKAK